MIGIPPRAASRETHIEATGKRQVAPTGDTCRRGRSQRNWDSHMLLVWRGNGAARPLGKPGRRAPRHDPRLFQPRGGGGRVCPREPTTAPHDSASPGVHHGIAHRHHKAEETPRSSHRRTRKPKVVPPRERRLLARPGKERPGEGTQPEHAAARADQERSRFSRRGRTRETAQGNASVYPKRPAQANQWTESPARGRRGLERVGRGESRLRKCRRVSFWGGENVPKLQAVMLAHTCA